MFFSQISKVGSVSQAAGHAFEKAFCGLLSSDGALRHDLFGPKTDVLQKLLLVEFWLLKGALCLS